MKVPIDTALNPDFRWTAKQNDDGSWSVSSSTDVVFASGLTERAARMVAGAPQMLRFVAGFLKWNSPAFVDAQRVLSSVDIELINETKNVKQNDT